MTLPERRCPWCEQVLDAETYDKMAEADLFKAQSDEDMCMEAHKTAPEEIQEYFSDVERWEAAARAAHECPFSDRALDAETYDTMAQVHDGDGRAWNRVLDYQERAREAKRETERAYRAIEAFRAYAKADAAYRAEYSKYKEEYVLVGRVALRRGRVPIPELLRKEISSC